MSTIGTTYLMIILLWCNEPNLPPRRIAQCRREKIACLRKLKDFTTDDVVDKCLLSQPSDAEAAK